MSDLIRPPGSVPEGLGRTSREAREVVRKVRLAGLKLQGDAALHGLAMELTQSLNHQRRAIAATDPELDELLRNHVVGFAVGAEHKIQTRHSPFGTL